MELKTHAHGIRGTSVSVYNANILFQPFTFTATKIKATFNHFFFACVLNITSCHHTLLQARIFFSEEVHQIFGSLISFTAHKNPTSFACEERVPEAQRVTIQHAKKKKKKTYSFLFLDLDM